MRSNLGPCLSTEEYMAAQGVRMFVFILYGQDDMISFLSKSNSQPHEVMQRNAVPHL